MDEALLNRILSASRKGMFRPKPIFKPYKAVDDLGVVAIERDVGYSLPSSLKNWLMKAGFCDLDEIAFRREFFRGIDRGVLSGHVIFAEDTLGNFYAFSPNSGSIFFVSRSSPEYAFMAADFSSFMEGLESRDFHLQAWTDGLQAMPYDWAV